MTAEYVILFHPKAEKEYLESLIWYENAIIGLGQEFFYEIENVVKRITENPLLYPKKKNQFREAIVKGFPYIIVYEFKRQKQQITILAVFHTKRNPKLKYKEK